VKEVGKEGWWAEGKFGKRMETKQAKQGCIEWKGTGRWKW
jgi:hypothetical protein